MNPIILFYSKTGNTEKLARRIRDDLQCEMQKVEPEEAYGNFVSSLLRVRKENANHIMPRFLTKIPDFTPYDVVLLGFPTWAQDVPAFVAEFMRQCDLRGKTVIPFTTFGIGGIDWSKRTLEKACKGAAVKLPFHYGMVKKDDYSRWIQAIKEENGNE